MIHITPILATGSPVQAVWLSFLFYLLNLLVPILPAVIIYRLFPEGRTQNAAVEGNVAGWKIKAIGAWGAYVTAFVLGFWAINNVAVPLIRAVGGASVWEVNSAFNLTDEKGNDLAGTVEKLQVEPPMVTPWGKTATITVFSKTLEPPDEIRLKLDGFEPVSIAVLSDECKDGKIKLPTITLKRQSTPQESIPPVALASLPAGQGPPTITTTH